jgi:DNA transformation protein and related proteins
VDKAALEDLFAPWARVGVERMFGGLGVRRDGVMFALVFKGSLYFKTDDASRAAFEAAGGKPFVYAGKVRPVSVAYWTPPDSIFDDDEVLREWADRAFAAAQAAQALKRPRARRG